MAKLELKAKQGYTLTGYGDVITIQPYLKLEEIVLIVQKAMEIDLLEVRDRSINLHVLTFCTDIEKEEIEKMGVDDDAYNLAVSSGLIKEVVTHIENFYDIYQYIDNYECTPMVLRNNLLYFNDVIEKNLDKLVKKVPKLTQNKISEWVERFKPNDK